MKKPTFRTLALPGILLTCLSLAAPLAGQTTSSKTYAPGVKPAITTPARPAIVRPATPARTIPATPGIITPAKPAIVTPAKPAIVIPAKPAVITPATPLPPGAVIPPGTIVLTPPHGVLPGTVVTPGIPIVPSYPSAWIGPTIIRETRSEPAPDPAAYPEMTEPMPTLRLVVLLGALKRMDATSGANLGLSEAPLAVSVGSLVGYAQNKPARAAGDFFGVSWDGRDYFAKAGDANQGPYLDHPVMTVNELQPGPWEFEAGMADRRMAWVRLAVTLFEDEGNPDAKPVNLPRGRRAAMREVLHRIPWTEKSVAIKSAGVGDEAAQSGSDVTHFGKALATFAEQTMAPSPDSNERVGIAEWYFPAQDLGKMLATCPRFLHESPDGARLREIRAMSGNKAPSWVRTSEFVAGNSRYAAELWFIIVPDGAVADWLQRK